MIHDIEALLRETGEILLDHRPKTRRVDRKSSHVDLVTDADRAADAHLLSRLARLAPDDSIISEESGILPGTSSLTWVLDPLDGTTNYIAGLEDFGVIIGLMEGDQPVAGGMFLPALDLLFLAERGNGATCNGASVCASDTANPEDAFIDHSLAYLPSIVEDQRRTLDLLLPEVRAVRCNHSLRYIANVVDGTYDGFVYHSLWLWDLAGSSVILAEAGALVTDIRGADLRLDTSPSGLNQLYAVLSANNELHAELVEVMNPPG